MFRKVVTVVMMLALIFAVTSATVSVMAGPPTTTAILTSHCQGGCVGTTACLIWYLMCAAQAVYAGFEHGIEFIW